jgi:hypothetical protein
MIRNSAGEEPMVETATDDVKRGSSQRAEPRLNVDPDFRPLSRTSAAVEIFFFTRR